MSDADRLTQVTRLSRKQRDDRAALNELLDVTRIGHFALARQSDFPVVIPTAIVRDGDRVLAHGSTGSQWMSRLAQGAPTCLAVTALDGLVVARSAFESSLHYRSAVLFGQCRPIASDQHLHALDLITDALLPGRVAELRRPTRRELDATLVLEFAIERWSLKVSDGWPDDAEDDVAGTAWAGVVPLQVGYGRPVPAPDLAESVPVPQSVRSLPDGVSAAGQLPPS